MQLKKIILYGFKSFADKTEFDFGEGVTIVVGPNGCGKSNIVDAVRWVLGEQSAKSLRGGQMLDVIFNGTNSRKSMGFAEVTLLFANTQGMLNLEAEEVALRVSCTAAARVNICSIINSVDSRMSVSCSWIPGSAPMRIRSSNRAR